MYLKNILYDGANYYRDTHFVSFTDYSESEIKKKKVKEKLGKLAKINLYLNVLDFFPTTLVATNTFTLI